MRKRWVYEVRSVDAPPMIQAIGWVCEIKRIVWSRWGFEVKITIHHMYGESAEQALTSAIGWVAEYGEVLPS